MSVKAKRAQLDQKVADKTFGLKNKSKSKVVQKQIKQITTSVKGASMAAQEKAAQEKKNAKMAKMQADEELRALFGAGLDAGAKKKEKSKQEKAKEQESKLKKDESEKVKVLKDYPFIADEMLASTGMLNELSPEELSIELDSFMKTGVSERLTLEQVIELQRAKMRSEGLQGTPVTERTLAEWKARKAERLRLAAVAKVAAELKKKKGGKGLSVLSGKELFAYNASLFVDDDEADGEKYERHSDAEDSDDEGPASGGGAVRPLGKAADSDSDSEDEKLTGNPLSASGAAEVAVALQESLYLDGDDDDLDDLDDLED